MTSVASPQERPENYIRLVMLAVERLYVSRRWTFWGLLRVTTNAAGFRWSDEGRFKGLLGGIDRSSGRHHGEGFWTLLQWTFKTEISCASRLMLAP